jgi:hypothetical protein
MRKLTLEDVLRSCGEALDVTILTLQQIAAKVPDRPDVAQLCEGCVTILLKKRKTFTVEDAGDAH